MWPKLLLLMACCLASILPRTALSETNGTTLLRQPAMSYAASGSYELALSDDWSSLAFDLFAPLRASVDGRASFADIKLGFSGKALTNNTNLSFGKVWRRAAGQDRIFGVNGYLDFGKKDGISTVMSQATFGLEYEIANPGRFVSTNLTFGSNLYLPLADYTAPRFGIGSGTYVLRRGMDSYVAWSRNMGDGMRMGARLSVFHYPATTTRSTRGIGTLSLTSQITRGLPKGMSFNAGLTSRYTPGEPLAPRLRLQIQRSLPRTAGFGKRNIGNLQPSSSCTIVPGRNPLDQLQCGEGQYTAMKKHDYYTLETADPEATVTVPAPERQLGYGILYVP